MGYRAGDSYFKEFTTSDPTTGAAADATGTPVATPNHNGTDDGAFTLTVTHIDTGRYKITGTIPSGYVGGDVLNVTVAATVNTVPGKAAVDTQLIEGRGVALLAAGLDAVTIESGLNARQALAIATAAVAGKLTGAAGPTTTISAAGVPGTTRISADVDSTGRTSVTLTPPA